MAKILTVVIPAYNVGSYIGECIRSVLCQSRWEDQVQIVVVVDGATDDTLAQTWIAANGSESLVQIILQENAGLSAARNAGLNQVATEYVAFLDGDDVWESNYLATVMPLLLAGEADIIEFDARFIDEQSRPGGILKIASAACGQTSPTNREKFAARFLCYAWARVYRTELIRRHLFPSGLRFEDTATTPWHYWNSQHQVSIGYALVGYRQRPDSILKTPSPQDIEDLAKTIANAASMYQETRSMYWRCVAHRIFQQACRRVTWQPVLTWRESLHNARDAIAGVPPPPGFSRWTQMNATLPYTAALYIKRLLSE